MKEKNYREDELPDLDQQLESLPDESGYHDQKKKAEGKSRSRRTDGEPKKKAERSSLKNGQRRPKEAQAERSGASKKKEKQMTNKELTRVTYIFVTLFLVLMGYLVYFNVVKSKEVVNSTYNIRQDLLADRVLRGSITDKNGEVLAQTVTNDDGSETREYPEGEVFSHVVGYAAKGKSGLESSQNFNLLTSNAFFLEKLANEFKDQKNTGDTVVTTLDANLQNAAYNALGDNKGAVVVMEPSTGKILAMVSKPSFDPNNVSENWDALNNDENSSLLNRATLGQYTPGSTFKLVTTLAFMRQNPDYNNYSFECNGEFSQNGATIHCYNSTAHGEENLTDSVANSCNSSFSNIGLQMDKAEWRKTAKQMLFNSKLPGDVKYNESSFRLKTDAGDADTMMTAIGQGETQVSPYHMAMIVSAIANGGKLMKPYLVDKITNYAGTTVMKYMPESYKELMTSSEAAQLTEYMKAVVDYGTGAALSGASYTVAGKTGTAEVSEDGNTVHSWFVGFSNVDNPELAISVCVEDADTATITGVSVAKQVFDSYYNN